MVSYSGCSEDTQQNIPSESYLHSMQRPTPTKTNKKPLNSLAQLASVAVQPRVYKVKPIHFRELVQRLTGVSTHPHPHPHPRPQHQPQPQPQAPYLLRLQNQNHLRFAEEKLPYTGEVMHEEQNSGMNKNGDSQATAELALSPNFQPWFSLALSSPGSVL